MLFKLFNLDLLFEAFEYLVSLLNRLGSFIFILTTLLKRYNTIYIGLSVKVGFAHDLLKGVKFKMTNFVWE